MIDIAEIERIIAFAVPIESKDCKRVVAKKYWRRQELRKALEKLIDKEATWKLGAMTVADAVRREAKKANHIPDLITGGTIHGPICHEMTGDHDKPEYIIPPDAFDTINFGPVPGELREIIPAGAIQSNKIKGEIRYNHETPDQE